MSTFTVRPSNSEKEAFRVKLTAASLLLLKVKPGDIVLLQLPNDNANISRPAIAWENSGNGMKDTIVQASKVLQELYGFKLGDRIGLSRSTEVLKDANNVVVKFNSTAVSESDKQLWQSVLPAVVPTKHDILAVGQNFLIEIGNKREVFEVVDVGGLLGRIKDDTKFTLSGSSTFSAQAPTNELQLSFSKLGGLQPEVEQVQKLITLLLKPQITSQCPSYRAYYGLLLYGAKGTGKTIFLEELANANWGSVVWWTPGIKLPPPAYPRLIIADIYDATGTSKTVSELTAIFREIDGTPTFVVGEARHPNDISERLRSIRTFAIELELPVPDSDKRLEILRVLSAGSDQLTNEQISQIASRTHGFVGADLNLLLRKMWESFWERSGYFNVGKDQSTMNGSAEHNLNSSAKLNNYLDPDMSTKHPADIVETHTSSATDRISQSDIESALSSTRPSALQQVFLEKPNVHWSDIGGQHDLKHRLTSAVQRTLSPTLRKRMLSLGLEVTKGVLLYGPPGCSKTLLAKALATESSLNFLAVKGAELISMYVGESERATREVFQKARAAAPSILFFDEIDAIASRGSSSRGGASDLNVLTTLLNEMDGFEELRNVIVIAATNKPQNIDPALLRPGRFDNVVYVGLPDVDTRREIFEKRFRGINVEEDARAKIGDFAIQTEGYSGAEVVAICKAAGEYAFNADRDCIELVDVENAIRVAPRGVTGQMLGEYTRWNAERGTLFV